jgi:superfamily I DNA/RNA helicase
LKATISLEEREKIWQLQEVIKSQLRKSRSMTRNLVCLELTEILQEKGVAPLYRSIFVDEVQDLPPVVLMFLKTIASHIVMAGDLNQTLYGIRSPFVRAGIDIRGKSRILNLIFRNTYPVLRLAEEFRRQTGLKVDGDYEPQAFRDGPLPELITSQSPEQAKEILADRIRFFTEILDYRPENIGVITYRNQDVKELREFVGSKLDMDTVFINSDSFEFTDTDALRFSTLHVCKGLDFPVVLLYLPDRIRLGFNYDNDAAQSMKKNLLYVALTRSLDYLNVIAGPGFMSSRNEIERALVTSFRNLSSST